MKKRRAVKKLAKILVDMALYGLMLILMSYPVTRGLLRHGVCGMAFVALLCVHHALNLSWHRTLFRGRWTTRRVLLSSTDILLLFGSAAFVASSLVMAGDVFAFAPFPMPWWGRELHTTATAWTFVLASFHLGLHGHGVWRGVRRLTGRMWPVAALMLFTAGAALFVHSGLWNDMLMTGIPKTRMANLPLFLTHYLGITLYFCLIARGIWSFAASSRNGVYKG